MDRANRIKEIIEYKQRRLDELADPNEWERITKNMECGEYKEFKQHCIDEEIIIAALRDQEQSKWISVKESLPKYNEIVLVVWVKHDQIRRRGFGTLQREGVWYVSNEGMPPVTHWMPLPELPEGGAEG